MIKFIIIICSFIMLACMLPLQAEPHFSVRYAVSCMQCHVNRTGGGMRNRFGRIFSKTRMPHREMKDTLMVRADVDSFRQITGGADMRVQAGAVFDNTLLEELHHSEFNLKEARVFSRARPFSRNLSLYLDLAVSSAVLAQDALVREAFILYEGRTLGWYVKAGRFFLPFGLRILNDVAYTREVTGFNFDNSDIGLEGGIDLMPFSASLSVSNGTQGEAEEDISKQVCFRGEYILPLIRPGFSASYNRDRATNLSRIAGGPMLAMQLGRFSLLGELDGIRETEPNKKVIKVVAFVEGDILVIKGLNIKLEHNYYDQDWDVDHDGQTVTRGGLEYTPFPFLQIRLVYSNYEFIPQNEALNRDQLFLEVHGFF
jgi:hypothetical protein